MLSAALVDGGGTRQAAEPPGEILAGSSQRQVLISGGYHVDKENRSIG